MTPRAMHFWIHKMKKFLRLAPFLFLLAACAAPAPPPHLLPPPAIQVADGAHAAWVQYGPGGVAEVRAAIGDSASCPALIADGRAVPMGIRAPATAGFPLLCSAPIPEGSKTLSIAGQALPLPTPSPRRILVLGDTGCRIKGTTAQACNDPKAWPFARIAAAAAALHPDLVLHLGDYLYRESACPKDNAGCAGSPHGDNWPSWNADFFAPAKPLLATAPFILVRGNHEDCDRAGPSWLRLLGPLAYRGPCPAHLPLYDMRFADLTIAVLDDSAAPDTSIAHAALPGYGADLAELAKAPAPVWLALHRPIWAAISGPLNIPIGGNATMIAAAKAFSDRTQGPLIPKTVALMLSGHIHSFEAINYAQGLPPQIVSGHGGDNLIATPGDLRGAYFQGDSGVRVKDGISVPGFGFLLLTKNATGWRIALYNAAGALERQCRFTPGGGERGRLDCPGD
jgi:hypothetical protein